MKRIQIDGIWYDLVPIGQLEPELDFTFSHSCHVETDEYCFEAIRICKDESLDYFYDNIDIEFTDKREKPWREEFWDNNSWMNGVIDGDEETITSALESMCHEGLATFTVFLKKLREIGWLTK
jgi:hypothetical protein